MDIPSSPNDVRMCFFDESETLSDLDLQQMFVSSKAPDKNFYNSVNIECVLAGGASEAGQRAIRRIRKAMLAGIKPVFVGDASSTTCYYLRDSSRRIVSVFKPETCSSDEINAAVYLRNGGETVLRKGFSGGGASREVAASLLDGMHVSGVPSTTMVSLKHPRLKGRQIGSMQAYAPHFCSAEDVSSSKFSVDQVHKIALLDVRMFNTDRHAGNMLVGLKDRGIQFRATARDLTKANTTLVPIDHGLCLPEFPALGEASFEWMNWSQSWEALHPDLLAYIRSLDVDRDAACLRKVLGKDVLSKNALLTLRVCTMWLQFAADSGLSFYQMGRFLCRPDLDTPSPLERIVAQFKLEHLILTSHARILSTLEAAMLQYIVRVHKKKAELVQQRVRCATPRPIDV